MSEKKSGVGKMVLIGCGGALLAGLCVIGSCAVFGGGIFAAGQAPSQTARDFLGDLRGGNIDGAYARMSPAYRAQTDRATFQGELAIIPALLSHTDATVTGFHLGTGGNTVNVNLDTAGGTVPIVFRLSKAGDDWFIDRVDRL